MKYVNFTMMILMFLKCLYPKYPTTISSSPLSFTERHIFRRRCWTSLMFMRLNWSKSLQPGSNTCGGKALLETRRRLLELQNNDYDLDRRVQKPATALIFGLFTY